MKKNDKKKGLRKDFVESKEIVIEEPVESTESTDSPEVVEENSVVEEHTTIVADSCQVSDKETVCESCDCCEVPEEVSYDFVDITVKGNDCLVNSKGFTKEQEKAISMTIFQMRNKFGLGSNFSVEVRKR